MSDSYISDDVFRIGVLSSLAGGLALFGYSQFLKKKSYLVEWRASVKPPAEQADGKQEEERENDVIGWVSSTSTFTERPLWAKSHADVIDRVFEIVRAHEKFVGVPADQILLEVPHIHVL